ncbi:MAG: serine acetyltransferase [Eubacteriaceae bacterium]|nr:serine acetyltransferase [Eubacteriaceae bacterium]
MREWLNNGIPSIAQHLGALSSYGLKDGSANGFGLKQKVNELIEQLMIALFPEVYGPEQINSAFIENAISIRLSNIALILFDILGKLADMDEQIGFSIEGDEKEALVKAFIETLPKIRETVQSDIAAAKLGDPAAKSNMEIMLAYPCLTAISVYRIANYLWTAKVPLVPRMMTEYSHSLTGIDIHPGAQIGHSFFIDHGTGVVIGETCIIGNFVKIYQGVTLGAKSFSYDEDGMIMAIKRHPNIEDNVVIYAGATILGGDTTVGENSVIGGNVWLTKSVPAGSIVYNSTPSPVIKQVDEN